MARTWGAANICAGDRILLTEMEHHSNVVPWQQLAEAAGAEIDWAPIDDEGLLDLEAFAELLERGPKLVAVAHVSNVLGTENPIAEIAQMAHDAGAIVLADGAQAAPKMPLDLGALGVDFYAVTAHKLYGPDRSRRTLGAARAAARDAAVSRRRLDDRQGHPRRDHVRGARPRSGQAALAYVSALVTLRIIEPPPRNGGIARSSSSRPQRADPGRPVELVPGEGIEVDPERDEVERQLRRRLGAVDEHQRPRVVRHPGDLGDRVLGAEDVGDVGDGDKLRPALEQHRRATSRSSNPSSSIGNPVDLGEGALGELCQGTMLEWYSISVSRMRYPAPMLAAPQARATRLIASVALRTKINLAAVGGAKVVGDGRAGALVGGGRLGRTCGRRGGRSSGGGARSGRPPGSRRAPAGSWRRCRGRRAGCR